MATLLLTAVGTMVGGPLGGALGAIAGRQIDAQLVGSSDREGPRLRDLALTTSSYGTAIPRHHGRMRAAGCVIWSTDLVESRETNGGGKGQPDTTSYSYSASFAVLLASRPIERLGRVWADGNLLRGAAGDLKAGGKLRIYHGHKDQQPDPLIASAEGVLCPAYRGCAYVVFESLELAEFGNRIPALTFEIIADEGEPRLAQIVETLPIPTVADRSLDRLEGYSLEGGSLAANLQAVDAVYPLACHVGASALLLTSAEDVSGPAIDLPPSASAWEDGIAWTRRARGAWGWKDEVETPMVEQAQRYVVGYGPIEAPDAVWETDRPLHSVSAAQLAALRGDRPGQAFWVRQQGSFALSPPLLIAKDEKP